MSDNKTAGYIGLAQRAGAVLYGEDKITEKLSSVKLVLIKASVSDKYKERIVRKCGERPVFEYDGLAEALHRDNVNAIAIVNESIASAIINLLR